MKKDESPKVNSVKDRGNAKNEGKIHGQKNVLTKPFLGCDTCKLKNNIPVRKPRTMNENHGKCKKNENCHAIQNVKIKLTDLCEEDKKRIVELMEELSKFAEKNRSLKELLDNAEKAKQEQNECLVKQTNLHLEEKNIFLKEIQTYKARLEVYETEMKEKLTKWESREKFMDKEIRYLAKALQKSFNEKSDLMKEIGHLKTCLKQSLESFELLRNEVVTLQRLSMKTSKPSQIIRPPAVNEEKRETVSRPAEPVEDFLSAPKGAAPEKSSLDVINSKLEQLYSLLQNRSVGPDIGSMGCKRPVFDELKIPEEVELKKLEKERFASDSPTEMGENKTQNELKRNAAQRDVGEAKTYDNSYKFLKPFSECSKTSIQAERILKKIEKPFCSQNDQRSGRDKAVDEDSGRRIHCEKHRKREDEFSENADAERMDEHFHEDRLLTELFYSDGVVDFGLESVLMLASNEKFRHPDVYSNN